MIDEQGYVVLVIGGGPAGMSAAITTSDAGLRTLLVDERPTLGGQIFKQPGPGFRVDDPRKLGRQWRFGRDLIDRAERSPAELLLRTAVLDLEPGPDGWTAILHTDGEPVRPLTVQRIVIAAGAHDRPVVFPGWTLPGVVTAGGLQTLAKTQRILPGKRMVFAGSGPVALAFPAQLAGFGADIAVALEAGPTPGPRDVVRIASAALGNASLLRDAAQFRAQLLRHRIPLRYGRIVVRAEGDRRVQRVVHAAVDSNWRVLPGTEETVEADLLCLGYGFVPSPELLRLSGCAFDDDEYLGGPVVWRDSWCRTTVPGIYAAGDGAGVEGSYVAIDEGITTGAAVAMDAGRIDARRAIRLTAPARRRLSHRRALTAATARMYRVGPGIYELAADSTVVCRCEEVRSIQLDEAMARVGEISAVKAVTRAGMGPCQGRNCQRHIVAMLARRSGQPVGAVPIATPRMPVRPVPISAMADRQVQDPGLFVAPEEAGAPLPEFALVDRLPSGQALPRSTNVLIVGGGIAGAAMAFHLSRAGVEVVLVERGELNREASGTNAGSFHLQLAIHQLSGAGTDADRDRLLADARLSLEAFDLWNKLGADLNADLGVHQTGGWMVAETEAQLQILYEKDVLEQEAGIETEVLTGAALRARAPYLAEHLLGATYCPAEGHANPLVVAPYYALRAEESGAEIRTGVEVQGIDVLSATGGRRFTVHTDAGPIDAHRIVNCAGAWSGDLAEMVGLHLPVRREGLHVNVTEARPRLFEPMIQHIGRRLTLKQTGNGTFIIGGGWPTGMADRPRRFPTFWHSAAGNVAVAVDVVPALADVRVMRTWSGVIVFTNDYAPLVGESALVPGFFACISSTGFTFSPLFAQKLAERMIDPGAVAPFPDRYSIDRLVGS